MWTKWKMLCNGFDPEIPQWKTYSVITFLKIQPTSTQQVTIHHPIFNRTKSKDIHSPFVPRLSIVSSSFVSPRSFWSSAILAAQPCSGHFRVVASEANGMLTWNEGIPLWSPELCIFFDIFWMVQLANAKGNHKILWERQLQVTTVPHGWGNGGKQQASKNWLCNKKWQPLKPSVLICRFFNIASGKCLFMLLPMIVSGKHKGCHVRTLLGAVCSWPCGAEWLLYQPAGERYWKLYGSSKASHDPKANFPDDRMICLTLDN